MKTGNHCPAIFSIHIDIDGTKRWYFQGKLHRVDGPAIETADGTKQWYLNDELHREDGPAVEWANGTKNWFLNGEHISAEVVQWITENQFPDYSEWSVTQKVMFVLRWG